MPIAANLFVPHRASLCRVEGDMTAADTDESEANDRLFADATRRIASGQMEVAPLIHDATRLQAARRQAQSAELYKSWIALNADHPALHAVYFNYAAVLTEVGDLAGAAVTLREAIRRKPDFYPPYVNLGVAFERLGHSNHAVREWMGLVEQLAAVNGDAIMHKAMALKQIGRVLETLERDRQAEEILMQCLDVDPEQTEVVEHLISLRQRQCKWPVVPEVGRVGRQKMLSEIAPLSLACYADDPMFQLATAVAFNKKVAPIPARPNPARARRLACTRTAGRLRIGYVSSDLRAHAVGFAMTDVIELHDRQNFEIFAYYCGIPRTDATQARLKGAAEHWVDISPLDDQQSCDRIEADDIDILVDLNGYTKDARTRVFAERPARIAVNWFGFPNTMGSPYHHYIIADEFVVPPDHEIYYSEKVVRLPCYQPNDRRRVVAAERPARREVGLPETGMVYCCLNGMQKVTRLTFERWMLILRHVSDSVLWLLDSRDETNARVKQLAAEHGVAPERVIFATRAGNPQHLARYLLADLFLDTLPYGSHTSASDALWMGVPVLTLPGRSFAARVCGSLVRAAGLPELVCAGPGDYVMRAVELGRQPERLAELKERLIAGRDTCLLFDTPLLVRHLEDLYRGMWTDFRAGRLPIPDMRNLDIYREIGLEQDFETIELLDDGAYRELYRARIADRDRLYPVFPDARMWPARPLAVGGLPQFGPFNDFDCVDDVDARQLGENFSAADLGAPCLGLDLPRDPAFLPRNNPILQDLVDQLVVEGDSGPRRG
jgi:predicted O-linked N-acetylglucosamine transferase (SPINDLY family)